MKNEKYKPYIAWGLTAFVTIVLCILFFFFLLKISELHAFGQTLSRILQPVIIGAVLAYVLTPVYNRVKRVFQRGLSHAIKKEKRAGRVASGIGIALSLALAFFIMYGLVAMVVPEILASIMGIVSNYETYFATVSNWVSEFMENDAEYATYIKTMLTNLQTYLSGWFDNTLMPNLQNYLYNLSIGVVRVVGWVVDLLIGFIVAAYLLGCKGYLCAQSKKMIYSVFKVSIANTIIAKFRYAHRVFGGFINGKLLDSLIIGIICFVSCSLLNIPYAMLVSVVIGVTNVIPFFGPFIGAIPSAFLILLNNPIKALYFVIFIIILQQFDGNILGPKILGDSTGLSSFWVLFSILLFGGLFGFVGMVVGVPLFAVIYSLVGDLVDWGLRSKHLSQNTDAYRDLHSITGQDHVYRTLDEAAHMRGHASAPEGPKDGIS